MSKQYVEDFRNYDKEAQELIKKLSPGELYELMEIVVQQLQRSCSDTRRKELEAVRKAIGSRPELDKPRLMKIIKGYNSSMAYEARAKDGNSRPNRKKA